MGGLRVNRKTCQAYKNKGSSKVDVDQALADKTLEMESVGGRGMGGTNKKTRCSWEGVVEQGTKHKH